MRALLAALQKHPVIPAVRDKDMLVMACESTAPAMFLLNASILDLPDMVRMAKAHDKRVFLHMDLAEGIGRDEAGVRWCVTQLGIDGIISTKAQLLKPANELGAITIQRLFLMDSASFEHGKSLLRKTPPDMAEVLPGIAPKAIRQLCEALNKPVIAGGLISEPHEVALALQAGATAVSVGEPKLWNISL